MALKPISVSQLNEYISRVIGTDPLLGSVVVKGEVSNLKYHSSGHVYFSIMDSMSKINCFLPRETASALTYPLADGIDVTLTGAVRIYQKNGTYSLYVKHVEIAGEGSLSIAFEQLKDKLRREGLFDPAHKKEIPKFPGKIGIITSRTGAAVQDILKILQSRNQMVDIVIFPVLVQGDGAAEDIANMIDFVDEHYQDIDTLIVGRGGGSADDLWAFNEEIVAHSIYKCTIPVISAVGHEIDFTIADFVADCRAETPTAAAQMAVPDTGQLMEKLEDLRYNLQVQFTNKLMYYRLHIDTLGEQMKQQIQQRLEDSNYQLQRLKLILEENHPQKILNGGYALLSGPDGKTIGSVTELEIHEKYQIRLKDGFAKCFIEEIGSDNYEKR